MLAHTPPLPSIGQPYVILPSVDSTNNYAMAEIRRGAAQHGSTFFAMEQTQGKGQRGKHWDSISGMNIMQTVVFQGFPPFSQQPYLLSACVALGLYDFFAALTLPEVVRIKWPNDLYWHDRKAGGILIETIWSGQGAHEGNSSLHWAIAGMGININQTDFDPTLPNPVSLKQITGKEWDVIALSRMLCEKLEIRFQELMKEGGTRTMQQLNEHLYRKETTILLKQGSQTFKTNLQGVDEQGRLITKDTLERFWNWGAIEIVYP